LRHGDRRRVNLRKVLFIVVALAITAIILTPALGYTNQAEERMSYSAISGAKVDNSFKSGVPAHRLTPDMVMNKYSIQSKAVHSTRIPYTFKLGASRAYSFQLDVVENGVAQGMKTKKEPALLGSMINIENTSKSFEAVAEPVEIETNTTTMRDDEPPAEPNPEPKPEPNPKPNTPSRIILSI
jgi:hypothetical protein